MPNGIVALVQDRVSSAAKRAVAPVIFAAIGGLFVLFALIGLFAALFFWQEAERGPITAALITAGVALVLAAIAFIPLAIKPRKPPPPPPSDMLPQFVAAMANTAPGLKPKQLLVTAVVVGAMLLLGARGGDKK
jgi:hypothetical protein